jgi:signal transduction histidine kinase
LVKDLRLISKADIGELPLEIEIITVDSILLEVEKTTGHLLIEKEIQLKINSSPHLPRMAVDKDRIIQVLRNIIENAIRYSPSKGKVLITVESFENQWVRFKIQDEGPGLAEEDLSRIFERFYRVDPSRTREQEGSGLGLAIARSIIVQHNGKIWAESQPGEGLSVIFEVPVASSEENQQP